MSSPGSREFSATCRSGWLLHLSWDCVASLQQHITSIKWTKQILNHHIHHLSRFSVSKANFHCWLKTKHFSCYKNKAQSRTVLVFKELSRQTSFGMWIVLFFFIIIDFKFATTCDINMEKFNISTFIWSMTCCEFF